MDYRDLVKQAATVNGTNPFSLGDAVQGFQAMHIGRAVGEKVRYKFSKGAEFEVGIGTIAANGVLLRSPTASSNGGELVNFSTGAGEIVETVIADAINNGLLDPDDVGFDIVLCAGQSNMAGRGTLDAMFDMADSRVWQFGCDPATAQAAYYRKIFSGADPLHMAEGIATGKTGPATSFARAYAASTPTNRRVLLIPLAEGGTALVGGSTPKWAPGNPGGTRYENAITQTNLAITAAKAIYPNSRVVGAIWVQGENDAINNITQAVYAAALKSLIAGWRARITGAADMWFVMGGMVPEQIANFPVSYGAIVAAQQQVAAEVDKCAYVPGPTGFAATSDTIHYKSEGSRILGGRMALAVAAAKRSVGAVVADTAKPSVVAAAVANATPTIVALSMIEPLDAAAVPAASAFTIAGHTVSSLAISGSTINLTVTPAFVFGEAARTASYVQPGTNGARDLAGNLLDSFTGVAITNNVAATDTTAPSVSSASIANAAPADIVITFNETLAAFTPAATAFAVSGGRAVSSVARAGSTITLTVNTPYASGDVVTVDYTKPATNPIQDAAGNQTSSFVGQTVTNNVAVADNLAPSFVSAQVANAAPTVIVATMNEALATSTPPTSAFSVSGGKTVSGVVVDGLTLLVTVNAPYAYGDTITLTYAQPGTSPRLQDAAGNATGSFGPVSVTNNVAAPPVAEPANTYTFTNDTVGAAPAGMTVTSGALEVVDAGMTGWPGKYLHYSGPATADVYRASLDNIPAAANRTVTWRRGVSQTAKARDCIVLRVGAGNASGITGAKHGYAFQVSGSTNQLRIYKFSSSSAAIIGGSFALNDVENRWFRASAIGTTLTFEYSDDGVNWNVAVTTTDSTHTTGGVDYVNGFGTTNIPNSAYIDDVSWS